jgi:hypothetical protein
MYPFMTDMATPKRYVSGEQQIFIAINLKKILEIC